MIGGATTSARSAGRHSGRCVAVKRPASTRVPNSSSSPSVSIRPRYSSPSTDVRDPGLPTRRLIMRPSAASTVTVLAVGTLTRMAFERSVHSSDVGDTATCWPSTLIKTVASGGTRSNRTVPTRRPVTWNTWSALDAVADERRARCIPGHDARRRGRGEARRTRLEGGHHRRERRHRVRVARHGVRASRARPFGSSRTSARPSPAG